MKMFHTHDGSITKRAVPPWLYKLFTRHQYPHVRRLAKLPSPFTEERQEPIKR
jgi:hypothetical protein